MSIAAKIKSLHGRTYVHIHMRDFPTAKSGFYPAEFFLAVLLSQTKIKKRELIFCIHNHSASETVRIVLGTVL